MAEATTEPLSMRPERVQSFLARARIAVLVWITASGDPMATPIWYRYGDGRFLMHTTYDTAKAQAIERSDRVCLCVQDPEPPHRYVTVRGRGKVIRDEEAALRLQEELAFAYFGRVGGRFYLRNVASTYQGEHVIIEVTPTRTSTMDGSEAVNPIALALFKAIRKVPGL